MVIVSDAEVAHCPAFGVKVYSVVCVLSKAGDHAPVTPFVDEVGNGASAPPAQIAETEVKVGVVLLLTVIVIVAVEAHCPASGVNV